MQLLFLPISLRKDRCMKPMFDTIKDMLKSQSALANDERERLTWYSRHPARLREEERRRKAAEKESPDE